VGLRVKLAFGLIPISGFNRREVGGKRVAATMVKM
jgi:hypothetical protein